MDDQPALYRAYHLRADGHILRAEIVAARNDAEALASLDGIANRHGIELWDRSRFVGKVAGCRQDDGILAAALERIP